MEGRINDDNLYMRLSRQNKILINYVQSTDHRVRKTHVRIVYGAIESLNDKSTSNLNSHTVQILLRKVVSQKCYPGNVLSR